MSDKIFLTSKKDCSYSFLEQKENDHYSHTIEFIAGVEKLIDEASFLKLKKNKGFDIKLKSGEILEKNAVISEESTSSELDRLLAENKKLSEDKQRLEKENEELQEKILLLKNQLGTKQVDQQDLLQPKKQTKAKS